LISLVPGFAAALTQQKRENWAHRAFKVPNRGLAGSTTTTAIAGKDGADGLTRGVTNL
jgi:hypothetical protein